MGGRGRQKRKWHAELTTQKRRNRNWNNKGRKKRPKKKGPVVPVQQKGELQKGALQGEGRRGWGEVVKKWERKSGKAAPETGDRKRRKAQKTEKLKKKQKDQTR